MMEKETNVDYDGLAAASAPYTEAGPTGTTEFALADKDHQLERGLKSRHIQFLALGMPLLKLLLPAGAELHRLTSSL